MPIDPTAAGATTGPFIASWSEADCMRYALSVGAAAEDPLGDDLRFTTENSAGVTLVALPTMCTVVGGALQGPSPLTALGMYDRKMSVHGSVELTLHVPLPTAATTSTTVELESVYDKRSGALANLRVDTASEAGEPIFTVRNGIFIRGEGGWGGDAGPAWPGPAIPERTADAVRRQTTRGDQPLLYRLNGDRNALHSDPTVAQAAGFDRPILHGLCTVGFASRAIVDAMFDGDPAGVAALGCRFAAPVLPGDTLETRMWRADDQVAFETWVGDRCVLSSGYAVRR